jgi:hypothetical protein
MRSTFKRKEMKSIKNITTFVVAGAMVLLGACESIEDREVLENTYNPDDIKVEVVQSSNGTGNGLTLKMNSPGVYGFWDYKLDKAYTDEVSFVSPFMGELEFTYYVSTPYMTGNDPSQREYVTKTVQANVQVADNAVPAAYTALAGATPAGKTWVFDGTGGDGGLWWFMSDPGNPWGTWWNAGGSCCPPTDVAGKMVFDLNKAANYTYYADAAGAGTKGTFKFNPSFTKLYVGGGINLLGASSNGSGNNAGEYTIVELTADRLVLHTGANNAGTGWTWVFVPEE